jgi:acyl carrier protein
LEVDAYDFRDWPPPGSTQVEIDGVYDRLARGGFHYGQCFRGLKAVYTRGSDLFAEVALPDDLVTDASRFALHPALLDAAMHAPLALDTNSDGAQLPVSWTGVSLYAVGASSLRVRFRRESINASLDIADASGNHLAHIDALSTRPVSRDQLATTVSPGSLFHVHWPPSVDTKSRTLVGRWVVVGSESNSLSEAVADRLVAAGASCRRVEPERLAEALPAEHVVCVFSIESNLATAEETLRVTSEGLEVVQRLSTDGEAPESKPPRLWWVTTGAVAATPADDIEPALAAVWGLGRTVMQEHPELACTLVDLQSTADPLSALLSEFVIQDDERQIAWRSGERRVARLVRAAAMPLRTVPELRTDGTVLITGGLGELGLHVARWLAHRGVKHLLLTGRRGTDTLGADLAVRELETLGARVTIAAVDVSDATALACVLGAIASDQPLRAVVHAAGALDDGVLTEQTPERVARVMSPKVQGACNLDALTRQADLDAFILFSSLAGTLGSAGQGPYAAANAFLDALAARRQAMGLPAQSLAWGLWLDDSQDKGAGLAARLASAQRARLMRTGVKPLSPSQGIALLQTALARPEPQLVAAPFDLRALRKALGNDVPPFWRGLIQMVQRAAEGRAGTWVRELGTLSPEQRERAILDAVRAEVARILSLSSADVVTADRPLRELGLDSLMAVELRNALGKRVGLTLPATLAYDHPTPAAIAKYVHGKVRSIVESRSTTSIDDLIVTLDRLDSSISAHKPSDEARERVVAKLNAVLSKWNGEGAPQTEATSLADRIIAADAETLLKIIDTTLAVKRPR